MIERDMLYKPRRGDEMLRAAPAGTGLYMYSQLASDRRPALEVLSSLKRDNIILLQDPNKMTSGHWISLSFRPERKEAYFFSSYGGRPDEEKNRWLDQRGLRRSRQTRNIINDGLKELFRRGWTIYYNDNPYQREGDDTATCGIWSVAFLNSGMNPDEFAERHRSAKDYYDRFFR